MAVDDSVPYVSLKNTKWLYRGEGNANLVITIPEDKVILRLEKCNYGSESSREIIERREKKLKLDVVFYKKIIVSFLGKVFIQPPFLGRISKDEVACLDRELREQRPRFRLEKGVQYEMVTIHPDYTYLPPIFDPPYFSNGNSSHHPDDWNTTFSIEIKPKQGWVYPPDRVHPKCTYCLNQYLKVKKKRVMRISKYCPLDLFSGDLLRMKKAIKNLLMTPQNNLKIFRCTNTTVTTPEKVFISDPRKPEIRKKWLILMRRIPRNLVPISCRFICEDHFNDGQLVYSDECKGNELSILKNWLKPNENGKRITPRKLLDNWSSLVAGALLMELSEEPPFVLRDCDSVEAGPPLSASPLAAHLKPCDWATARLPSNSILQRILTIQKLQNMPFHQLYETYKEEQAAGDYGYVENLLRSPETMGPVERYLLSTTAKDCSIFIAFHQTHHKKNGSLQYIEDNSGKLYQINIGISDIDPKPLSCIEKHLKRDQDLIKTILKQKIE